MAAEQALQHGLVVTSRYRLSCLSLVCPRAIPAERDVSRTDRTNKFYEGPENPGLGLLNDILLTYCMYHFDLGGTTGREGWAAPSTVPRA